MIRQKDYDERAKNTENAKKEINEKIGNEIINVWRNFGWGVRGIGKIVGAVIKFLPTAEEIAIEGGNVTIELL